MRDCCEQLSPKHRRAAVYHVLECRPFKALAQFVGGIFIPDGPASQFAHTGRVGLVTERVPAICYNPERFCNRYTYKEPDIRERPRQTLLK